MAVGDLYRVAIVGVGQQGQELVNVHYYEARTSDPDDKGTGLIDALVNDLIGPMSATISDQVIITGIQTRNVDQPLLGEDYTLPTPEPGTITGEVLPPMVAAVVGWRTGLIGRRARGRTYVWPTGESTQNGGQWNSGYLTALNNFGTAALLVSDPNSSAVYRKHIYSVGAVDPNTGNPLPPARYEVTGYVVDVDSGIQRRRRRGAGS